MGFADWEIALIIIGFFIILPYETLIITKARHFFGLVKRKKKILEIEHTLKELEKYWNK